MYPIHSTFDGRSITCLCIVEEEEGMRLWRLLNRLQSFCNQESKFSISMRIECDPDHEASSFLNDTIRLQHPMAFIPFIQNVHRTIKGLDLADNTHQ